MLPEFSTLIEFNDFFNSDKVCRQYLVQLLWNGIPRCPHCKSYDHYEYSNGKTYKCKSCKKKYTVTIGTIFESSKISLRKWFLAVYLDTCHSKGVSAMQLMKEIGVCYKTAWFMLHRIREMYKPDLSKQMDGVVQIDETFVGGKNKNRHWNKKTPQAQGRSFSDKTPVMGMLSSEGELRAFVIDDTKAETLLPLVVKHVKADCIIVTDEWSAYKGLNGFYHHEVVDHQSKKYVNDSGFTTNGVENAWTILKRAIIGVYHYVSPKHMQRYVNGFIFRYNTRGMKVSSRFEAALKNSPGRLKYTSLIRSRAA